MCFRIAAFVTSRPYSVRPFRVYRRLRRIQVFRNLSVFECAAAKGDDGSGVAGDWNHQTVPKPVRKPPALSLDHQPATHLQRHRHLPVGEPACQCIAPGGRRVTIPKNLEGFRRKSPVFELPPRPRPGRRQRAAPYRTPAASSWSLTSASRSCGRRALVRPALGFGHLHSGALRQVPDGLRKRHLLMELDELDGVAAGAAPETLEEVLVGVDVERRRLLLMERTESLPRVPHLLQRHDVADERDDVRLRFQVVDEGLGEKGHQSFSSTIVAPSPPSLSAAGATLATSGCDRTNDRNASRSRPVPWPCTMRSRRSSATIASSRSLLDAGHRVVDGRTDEHEVARVGRRAELDVVDAAGTRVFRAPTPARLGGTRLSLAFEAPTAARACACREPRLPRTCRGFRGRCLRR